MFHRNQKTAIFSLIFGALVMLLLGDDFVYGWLKTVVFAVAIFLMVDASIYLARQLFRK